MKKIVSTLLVMMMLFSCTLVSVQAATPKITLNEPTEASFTKNTKELKYKFGTTSNDSFYRITLKNVSVDTPLELYVYDKYNKEVAKLYYRAEINDVKYVDVKLKRNDYYYIIITRTYDHYASVTGNVRFSVRELVDDIPDTMNNAKAMTLGKKYVKEITAGQDVDYYKFTTTSNDSFYRIKLKNISVSANELQLYITSKYDDQLDKLEYVDINDDMQTDLKLEPKTTYYLYVETSKKFIASDGKYELSVTEIKDDAPEEMEKAVKLYSNLSYFWDVNASGDVDWFRWTADTKKLEFSVKNYLACNLYVEVYDKYGSKLAGSYAYKKNRIDFNIAVKWGEKYYIKVYSNNNNYVGDYVVDIGDPVTIVSGGTVILYSADGRIKKVDPSQIAANEKVGWYTEPLRKLYTPDGRSKYFVTSQVYDQLAVGWYTEPVQRLYAEGKYKVFPKSQVAAQLTVGWYTEPVQRLYAKGGRSKLYPQSQVSAQLKVGWYTYPVS